MIFPFEMLYFGPDILFIPAGLLDWKLLGDKFPPSQPSRSFAFSFPCKSTMDIFGQCLMLPVLETLFGIRNCWKVDNFPKSKNKTASEIVT